MARAASASTHDNDLMDEVDVRVYEFCILYPYPFNQKDEQELVKGIEEIFAEAGAKQVAKDAWGRRGLAYTIGGFTEGNVIVYYMEMDPRKLKEIDKQLRILKGVLRHMVVKPPMNYAIVSYAEKFVRWQEDQKLDVERAARDREEKLQRQVVEKAKRMSKPISKKAEPAETKPMSEEAITKEVEKLISDEDLKL